MRIGYREIVAGRSFLLSGLVGTSLGMPTLPFYSIAIFASPMAKTFHWSMSTVFSSLLLVTVVLFLTSPVIGLLTDRYGARRLAALSLAGLGVSFMALALSTGSILQYELTWLAIAVTGAGATPVTFTRAISGVFHQRRGLALGIVLSGTGFFVLLIKPLALGLMPQIGWRGVIVLVGLLPITIAMPAVLWGFRGAPSSNHAVERRDVQANHNMDMTLRKALASRPYWLLVTSFAIVSLAGAAPFTHIDNIFRSARLAPREIISLASVVGVAIIAGRLVGGWILDRVWAPLVGTVIFLGGAGASLILSTPTVDFRTAAIAASLLGFAAGTEFDLLSFLIARYIGLGSYGVVYGSIYGVFSLFVGVGPIVIALAYDRTGNYQVVMRVCGALFVVSAAMVLALGRYPSAPSTTLRGLETSGSATNA